MNHESAADYAHKIIKRLGVQAHDSERVAIECYDHRANKPLPDVPGVRDGNVYVPKKLLRCLFAAMPKDSGSVDALASSILLLWIQENLPGIWTMLDRHEQELEARLAELRQNEPGLQEQTQWERDPNAQS